MEEEKGSGGGGTVGLDVQTQRFDEGGLRLVGEEWLWQMS